MKGNSGAKGFTLLEVLIAVVILGVGLLGLAGLLMVSVRTNQSAYSRSQASFLAQSMADRMRNNQFAVWSGTYNATVPTNAGNAGTNNVCPCNATQIAGRDLFWWSQEIHTFLPNAGASIRCVRNPAAVGAAPPPRLRVTYDGTCTLTMTWSESTLNVDQSTPNAAAPDTQTFVWAFQP